MKKLTVFTVLILIFIISIGIFIGGKSYFYKEDAINNSEINNIDKKVDTQDVIVVKSKAGGKLTIKEGPNTNCASLSTRDADSRPLEYSKQKELEKQLQKQYGCVIIYDPGVDEETRKKWQTIASNATTVAECEQLPPSNETTSCYYHVAVFKNDESLCEKGDDSIQLCTAYFKERLLVYSESEAKAIIEARSKEVLQAIKDNDFNKLSTYVHPQKGVRFSRQSFLYDDDNVIFTADKIRNLASDNTEYHWGWGVRATPQQYFKYALYYHDYLNVKDIYYNKVIYHAWGAGWGNIPEVFPKSIGVEYFYPGSGPMREGPEGPTNEGYDWRSLILVYQEYNNNWYLVAIDNNDGGDAI